MTWGTYTRILKSATFIRIRTVLLLFRLLSVSFFATGGHIAGSEISYRSAGNRTYEVTYRIYTDQTGGCPGTLTPIEARSINCGSYLNDLLSLQTPQGEHIGPGCGSSANPVVFTRWTYTGTIQLPFDCDDWKLSTNECCRGASINSIQSPDQSAIYSEVWINTTSGNTTSMDFQSLPSLVVWEGQSNRNRISISGSGLDSIRIETARPRISIASDVNYLAGYSENTPLRSAQPISMNGTTGEFEIQPLQSETGVIAYRATGFVGGRAISSIFREHRLVSVAPTNHLPQLSGVDGSDPFSMNQCAGNTFNRFFLLNDIDQSADPTVTEIIGLPGAHFNINNGILQLEWAGSANIQSDTTIFFSLRISDQQCPIAAEQVFAFELIIRRNGFSQHMHTTLTDATCANSSDGSILLSHTSNIDPVIRWSDGDTSFHRTDIPPGMYYAIITDRNSGCSVESAYGLGFDHLPPVISLGADQVMCEGNSLVLGPGNGFSSYSWNDGSNASTLSVDQSGYYHVTVTDQHGCSGSASTNIQYQICTGIEDNIPDFAFRMYPNPATDFIRFHPGSGNGYTWRILDTTGRMMLDQEEPVHDEVIIDVEHLNSGIYLLQWSDSDGEHIARFFRR